MQVFILITDGTAQNNKKESQDEVVYIHIHNRATYEFACVTYLTHLYGL